MQEIACDSIVNAKIYRKKLLHNVGAIRSVEALAYLFDCEWSRQIYQSARNRFVRMNNNGYPPYNKVLE